MKYTLAIKHISALDNFKPDQFDEIVIYASFISKLGLIKFDEIKKIILFAQNDKVKLVLALDVLFTDEKLKQALLQLERFDLFNQITTIRFLDKGVGYLLKTQYPHLNLQLILEHESHNALAIEKWVSFFSPQLTKIILSNEVPYTVIKHLKRNPQVQIELLGSGKIEIFYSPRGLLTAQFDRAKNKEYKIYSKERESSLRNIFLENEQGSFLFYERELYILDCINELDEAKIDSLLIDQDNKKIKILSQIIGQEAWQSAFKKEFQSVTKGFFKVNKTDTQFKRLKNPNLILHSSKKIGQVIEQRKNAYLIIRLTKKLTKDALILFHTPEGFKIEETVSKIQHLNGDSVLDQIDTGFYKLPWISKVLPKSSISLA